MTAPTPTPGIAVRELCKRFSPGDGPACEDVTFTAPAGQITALLGPSGSGKTTALRIIAGLERADRGVVSLDGRDLLPVPVRERNFGFVFQGYALFAHLTVRDNLAFGLDVRPRIWDRRARQARVDELLALLQLEGLGERFPGELSGGQRQRVAFGRALAPRPPVLLLDEPFGALDARVRVELRRFLQELHTKVPTTTLLVTHDQDEALELAQHVVVMHQGRVEQAGTPIDIYDQPRTPFVASFIGNANPLPRQGSAQAFVRPDEITVSRLSSASPPPSALDTRLAEVVSLVRIGSVVKLEVKLPSGERLIVQLTQAESQVLALSPGELVVIDTRRAKVFVEDYAI